MKAKRKTNPAKHKRFRPWAVVTEDADGDGNPTWSVRYEAVKGRVNRMGLETQGSAEDAIAEAASATGIDAQNVRLAD